ncbi:hypothetical protein F2Q68_00029414 [Brassica cretica]|uniref:Uncharacterized protein n=1 Tax=Brassica cretica TaxID=69181 RepID=A0A8S9G7R9_BRACR|nr:hypothetical protein F2Q68_00029414 [Brassica cretica]
MRKTNTGSDEALVWRWQRKLVVVVEVEPSKKKKRKRGLGLVQPVRSQLSLSGILSSRLLSTRCLCSPRRRLRLRRWISSATSPITSLSSTQVSSHGKLSLTQHEGVNGGVYKLAFGPKAFVVISFGPEELT